MARTETVTVLLTDLVGSTELASQIGHDGYEQLRREHFAARRSRSRAGMIRKLHHGLGIPAEVLIHDPLRATG